MDQKTEKPSHGQSGSGAAYVPAVDKAGIKHDTGKDRWDLLPTDAVREVVKVITFGATKYAERNWEKGLSLGRVYGATLRHLTSFWEGEDEDPETGLSHLAHAGCCVLFMLAYQLRGMSECDDRPQTQSLSEPMTPEQLAAYPVELDAKPANDNGRRLCVSIESPYAGDVANNEAYLRECIRDSLKRGEAPFASHRMYTEALDDGHPEERQLGIEAGLAWHDRVDMAVFYIDRGLSPGMQHARDVYLQKGVKVLYRQLRGYQKGSEANKGAA